MKIVFWKISNNIIVEDELITLVTKNRCFRIINDELWIISYKILIKYIFKRDVSKMCAFCGDGEIKKF